MPASNLFKGLMAIAAGAAFAGSVIAQGTPPTQAADPAVGAGQQSTQATPMGTTGTQASGTASGTMSGSASGTDSSMGSTSGAAAGGSSMDASGSGSTRTMRADRN